MIATIPTISSLLESIQKCFVVFLGDFFLSLYKNVSFELNYLIYQHQIGNSFWTWTDLGLGICKL